MQALLPASEVERAVSTSRDDEPEQVDVEVLGCLQVGHLQLDVRRAQNVERRRWRATGDELRRGRHRSGVASCPEPGDPMATQRDVNGFDVAVELERVVASFASES